MTKKCNLFFPRFAWKKSIYLQTIMTNWRHFCVHLRRFSVFGFSHDQWYIQTLVLRGKCRTQTSYFRLISYKMFFFLLICQKRFGFQNRTFDGVFCTLKYIGFFFTLKWGKNLTNGRTLKIKHQLLYTPWTKKCCIVLVRRTFLLYASVLIWNLKTQTQVLSQSANKYLMFFEAVKVQIFLTGHMSNL